MKAKRQHISISGLPEYVVVHLKRFTSRENGVEPQ